MIALLYAYLTRLGWRQSATHPNPQPTPSGYGPVHPSVIPRTVMDIPMPNRVHALMEEVRRLRTENAELRADLADAKYREDHDGY